MSLRYFGEKIENDYIRHVETFSTFLSPSPTSRTGEDLRARRPPPLGEPERQQLMALGADLERARSHPSATAA